MTGKDKGHFEIEDRGAVLIVRVDGGPHALFGPEIANELEALVDRVDHDPRVHAVVITGAHPKRFISHTDVRWLQEGGAATPSVGQRGASAIARAAEIADRARVLLDYLATTDATGELPLYNPDTYARALESGRVPGRRSTDGA